MDSAQPPPDDRQADPFLVTAGQTPTPAQRLGSRRRLTWRVLAALAVVVPLLIYLATRRTPSSPDEQVALRDAFGRAGHQARQDATAVAQAAGLYGELYWRATNPNERLLVACKYGDLSMVESQLRAGADVNTVDHAHVNHQVVEWEGATPLMLAAAEGHQPVAELLLRHGALVNGTDAAGETALLWAIRNDHEPLALLLVARGADANAASPKSNSTPYGLALAKRMNRLADALKTRGGHF